MSLRRQASMRMIGLLRRPRTRTNRHRLPAVLNIGLFYEPQTTFPAFTVVLIFMLFSSCLRLLIVLDQGSTCANSYKSPRSHSTMPATPLKRTRREPLPRFPWFRFKAGSKADLTFLLGGPNVCACFSGVFAGSYRSYILVAWKRQPHDGPEQLKPTRGWKSSPAHFRERPFP